MTITHEFLLVIIVQCLTAGVFVGGLAMSIKFIETQIKHLEEKQDKHNSLIERMAIVEQSLKSAHKRLDDIK